MQFDQSLDGFKHWTNEAEEAFAAGNTDEASAAAQIAQAYAALAIKRAMR